MKDYKEALDLLVDKIEGNIDMGWQDIVDELELDIHPDSLRKAFAVTDFSGYNVLQYFNELIENGMIYDDAVKLEEKREELYKERVKLQDQRRELNKLLREEARFEHLIDVMKEEIEYLPEIKLKSCNYNDKSKVDAALLVSDLHYGAHVDNALNYYDTEVCKERLQTLLNKTIYYCNLHKVNTLYVNLGGDLVSGIIHVSTRCEQEEDIISQTMQVAELLANFIAKLTQHIPHVKVACVQGNHSRVNSNLKENLNAENFERVIFEYIKMRLPKIQMIRNGLEDWVSYKIKDRTIFLEHGDKTKLASIKEKAVNLLGYAPTDIFCGHWHRMQVLDDNNTDVVVNGSVMGVDNYSIKCRFNSQPHQVLRIYGDDVLTYKIILEK